MAQNSVEKIAQHHAVRLDPDEQVQAGDSILVRPEQVMTHDHAGAVRSAFRSTGHQFVREEGYVTPGALVVAGDTHVTIYGALAALGVPVTEAEAADILSGGVLRWQVPSVVQVNLTGRLPLACTGSDVGNTLTGILEGGQERNCAIEFCGKGIMSLSITDRKGIAGTSTDMGVLTAFFPFDEKTRDYFLQQAIRTGSSPIPKLGEEQIRCFETDWFRPDPDARYAAKIDLDLSTVRQGPVDV